MVLVKIPKEKVIARIRLENPWWESGRIEPYYARMRPRAYFEQFRALVEEVRGEGVVGNQPMLRPGEQFEYTSGAVLKTPHGSMHGTYRMVAEDGRQFDAEIAPFPLTQPGAVN